MKQRRTVGEPELERVRALTARSVANGARTKAKLLQAAEALFATDGFEGTSMRQIAQDADVPLALVAYHFKSKLGIYKAVFQSRLEETSQLRLARLQAVDSRTDPAELVRSVTRILVEPIVQMETAPEGRNIARLIARETNDPRENERGIIEENFDAIAHVAIAKLKEAFPLVGQETIYWAYLFAAGALAINHAATGRIERLSSDLCRSDDTVAILENLVEFIAGGILAAFAANARTDRRPGTARKAKARRTTGAPA